MYKQKIQRTFVIKAHFYQRIKFTAYAYAIGFKIKISDDFLDKAIEELSAL